MPTFYGYLRLPASTGNVHYMLVVLDQPRAKIFQISSFRMTYFSDMWTLPSPSATMDEIGHIGMATPLSATEVAYSLVQQTSVTPDPIPAQELDPLLEPIWAQDSLTDIDSLDLVLPSDEAIIEAMTGLDKP